MGQGQYAVLGEGETPAYDPSAQRIAFSRRVGSSDQLFTMKAADGTDLVQVSQGDFSCRFPEYSPDGRWILFSSNRSSESNQPAADGRLNLYAIHPDGSDLTQVTDGNARNAHPAWGRDGWIYFESNQAGNFDIWRVRPEGALASSAEPAPAGPAATPPGARPAGSTPTS
jgi:TolB protein